ncbi:hypothetical protein Ahp2_71 [Aeromonas phage Ahp2]|nr:hypothetical protein Ahp2_71 [Aeromonas phage Ahp2]
MKLNVNTDSTVTFNAIGDGKTFSFICPPDATCGGIYIKSKMGADTSYNHGTRLHDGMIRRFAHDTKVIPLDLMVVNA